LGIAALRAALVAAAALAFFYAVPAAGNDQRMYGRELVAQFQLPSDAVARYAALASAASRDEAAAKRTGQIDNAMWVGPLQPVGIGRNPYTMVLTVSGVARASGDIRTRWQAGWEVRESPVATREVLMSVGTQLEGSTMPGTPVTLIAVSAPLTFRGDRQAAPLLNLAHANNLDISGVHLQVWSGSAPFVAWPAVAAPRPALLGLGALCLLSCFLLRRTAARPLAPAPSSRLPPAEQQQLLGPAHAAEPAPEARAAPTPQGVATPPPNASSRVVNALRDVLMQGLAVPTELDDRRRRRAR
jgi:hypothetical protein